MADKRMFTQKIIDSDAFLDMPLSAQALYFHLNMRADDDGFINNPKKIMRTVGASEDDLKLLLLKRFLLQCDGGVLVIKHWRMHNTIRRDRYKPTDYQDELSKLFLKPNGSYTDDPGSPGASPLVDKWLPSGCQVVAKPETNGFQTGTTDKNRIDKNRLGLDKIREDKKREEREEIPSFSLNFLSEQMSESMNKSPGCSITLEEYIKLCKVMSFKTIEMYMLKISQAMQNGKVYTRKSHYQAILDMATADNMLDNVEDDVEARCAI